jgi:ribosomal protein S18 acetylase RimI-like enzyme
MDNIAIRAASIADGVHLLPLIQAYWRHDGIAGYEPDRLQRQLDAFLANPGYGCGWLATHAGSAVGYLLCTLAYSFEHGGLMAEIDELFVSAEYRRRGIGQALLAGARSTLLARGCVGLQMQVADSNTQSQGFYSRLGFKEKSGYRIWVSPLTPNGSDA